VLDVCSVAGLRMRRLSVGLTLILSLTLFTGGTAAAQKKDFPLAPGASCVSSTCHADTAKKKFVHAVAADGGTCSLCHQPQDNAHRFKFPAEGAALCAQCHPSKSDKKFVHTPVAAGLCTMCHNPHQSDYPKQLNSPPAALCLTCHDKKPFQGAVTHAPVANGQCIQCHNPHTSDQPRQLQAAVPQLCFTCHDKPQKDAKGVFLPPVKATFEDKELVQHMPFAMGGCLMCHNQHAGPNYRLLVKPYPESFYASFAKEKYFCFSCHNEKAFAAPRTMTDTEFRNGNLNLHYRHVNRKKGRTCRACHDHHGDKHPKLIRGSVPFGSRHITIDVFEKTETGGKCGPTCHAEVRYDRFEPVRNPLKVTPREGQDAAPEELERARAAQTKRK